MISAFSPSLVLGGKNQGRYGGTCGYGNVLDRPDDAVSKGSPRVFGPGFSKELPDVARLNQRWLGLFEQARAVVKWSVCRFHAAARSGWLK